MARIRLHRIVPALVTLAACGAPPEPPEWGTWRGPSASGVAPGVSPPISWSADSANVRWRAELPGAGSSTPVAAGGRAFLTAAARRADGELDRLALAFDLDTGEELWRVSLHAGPAEQTHELATYANPSPATDGRSLFVYFGPVLAAFDLDGETRWRRDVDPGYVEFSRYGAASSLTLTDSAVVLLQDREWEETPDRGWLAAFDKETGKELWRDEWSNSCCSYTSPLVLRRGEGQQIVRWSTGEALGYAADTGRRLWRVQTETLQPVPTPVAAGDLLCNSAGVLGRETLCMGLSGTDEATAAKVLWRTPGAPRIPSPVLHDDILFTMNDLGVLSAYDAPSGRVLWKRRLKGGRFRSSLLAAADRVYATSSRGVTTVVKAGHRFELLAENHLGESVRGSMAVAGGCLLIRTEERLWCIAGDPDAAPVQ